MLMATWHGGRWNDACRGDFGTVRGANVHTQNGWYVLGIHRWESDQEATHGYAINVTKRVFSAWADSHGEQEFTVPLLQKLLSDINKRAFREALVKEPKSRTFP